MGVALWSSSSQHLPKPRDSLTMAATSVLSTIKDLINDDVFVEKTQELSRLFYSNSDLTIDLYVYLAWGTAIAAVLLLMFLLFGDESKLGKTGRLQLLRLLWLLIQLLEKKRECQLSSHWRRPNNPFQDENKTAATGNILAKKPTNILDLN